MASAKNVILYTGLSNKKGQEEENCVCGLLVVTNFKLSFLTKDDDQVGSFFLFCFFPQKHLHNVYSTRLNTFNRFSIVLQNMLCQENFFLQRNDVTLQNIDQIYQIVDRKKRLVDPYSKISQKLEGLHIVCKVCIHRLKPIYL